MKSLAKFMLDVLLIAIGFYVAIFVWINFF